MLVTPDSEPRMKTALVFGPSGAGKTWLCCTWPRVAWFGSAREGGYETALYMRPEHLYEPDHPPKLYKVSGMPELLGHLNKDVMPLVDRGIIQTICVELSFYADDIIRSLKAIAGKNGWMPYETLGEHVKILDIMVKARPRLRLVYNTLASVGDSDKTPGGVLVPGRAVSNSIPAMCNLTGYLRATDDKGKVARFLHLQPYGPFMPRHRYGDLMPPFVRDPTFRKLAGLLDGSLVGDSEGNVMTPEEFTARAQPLKPDDQQQQQQQQGQVQVQVQPATGGKLRPLIGGRQ